ncbi:MATE family efflux transporter [Aquicoccus sp. SCR17]|nr:MATE family efflux transporter [Carideicomes alvinocaridis]
MSASSDLTFRGHVARLLALGLPLVGAQVASFAIHVTDTVMLGWYDITALAAATMATSLWFVIFILGSGFAHAVTPMAAAAMEAGDEIRARRVTRMSLWLVLGYAILAVALLWRSEPLLLAMGQTQEVAAEAQRYLRIAGWGLFPAIAGQALRGLLGAMQLTAAQLWITLAALLLNAGINGLLIFGSLGAPELGIAGAAIASVAVQAAQALALAAYIQRRRPDYELFRRLWRPDWPVLREVFRLGLPIGLIALAESAMFSASAVMMGWIGALELAAHGIALQLTALAFMFHVGMSQAATIRAGGQYGRSDLAALARGARAAYAVAFGFGALVTLIYLLAPAPLVALFVDPQDPQRDAVIAAGVRLVMIAGLFQFMDAGQIVAVSLLRGLQDTRIPMWLATLSYWLIGTPLGYLLAFPAGLGAEGLWLGLTAGLGAAALTLGWRFRRHLASAAPARSPA